MPGLIKLSRSPLLEGEPIYALGNIDQGMVMEGAHKGETKPKLQGMVPQVLEDGSLLWELLDSEMNRVLCKSLLPKKPNPPFAYSVIYPEDVVKTEEAAKTVLRTDGPTLFQYTSAGYSAATYPPIGYAVRVDQEADERLETELMDRKKRAEEAAKKQEEEAKKQGNKAQHDKPKEK